MFSERPDARAKVIAVKGDITQVHFGLNANELEPLYNEISVVIHSAACVRFNDHIQQAMNTNFQGVSNILEVAKRFRNLKAFVYVSTAYSNATTSRSFIKEEIYPTAITPQDASEFFGRLTAEEATASTPKSVPRTLLRVLK